MAKVKPDGHIWDLEFNQYVCFLFCGNRTIFDWDIANSMFDLENSRSRSWLQSNPMVTFEAQSSIGAFCFVAIRPFLAEIEQIPYLTLKILGQGHDENRRKSIQVIYRSGPTIVPRMQEIQKVVQKLSRGQNRQREQRREQRHERRLTNGYKSIKSPPVYRGDLISCMLPAPEGSFTVSQNVPCRLTVSMEAACLTDRGSKVMERHTQNSVFQTLLNSILDMWKDFRSLITFACLVYIETTAGRGMQGLCHDELCRWAATL